MFGKDAPNRGVGEWQAPRYVPADINVWVPKEIQINEILMRVGPATNIQIFQTV
jgi:hypothetical protein